MKRLELLEKLRGGPRARLDAGAVREERGAALDRSGGGSNPGGLVVDGTVWPLAGEPPVAVSKGWGDLSWARQP